MLNCSRTFCMCMVFHILSIHCNCCLLCCPLSCCNFMCIGRPHTRTHTRKPHTHTGCCQCVYIILSILQHSSIVTNSYHVFRPFRCLVTVCFGLCVQHCNIAKYIFYSFDSFHFFGSLPFLALLCSLPFASLLPAFMPDLTCPNLV